MCFPTACVISSSLSATYRQGDGNPSEMRRETVCRGRGTCRVYVQIKYMSRIWAEWAKKWVEFNGTNVVWSEKVGAMGDDNLLWPESPGEV